MRSKKQSPKAKKNSMDSPNTKLPKFLTAEREKKKREQHGNKRSIDENMRTKELLKNIAVMSGSIDGFRLNKQGLVDEPDGEFSRNS